LEKVGNSKIHREWGLKNIFHSSKALISKSAWRLIEGKGLWCQVVEQKYILLGTIED
jgi:hypothetical protein